ncbi:MAG: hypothetical protein DWQ05_06070 [Calditrichaeota bacterium]|nr:MAG: hypothetical protein DWQ05_06070 [Calditrichota bacterium]
MFKRGVTFFIFLILTNWGCSHRRPPLIPECNIKIPLSQRLIEEYITPGLDPVILQSLYNLQFSLEKELIVKLDKVRKSGRVLPQHILQLQRDYNLKELNFPPRVKGRAVAIIPPDSGIMFQPMKLKVEFDMPPGMPGMVLTFVPRGPNGTFVVDKSLWGNSIEVNNMDYDCAWGCNYNRLLVPICLIEEIYRNRRVARGFTFP